MRVQLLSAAACKYLPFAKSKFRALASMRKSSGALAATKSLIVDGVTIKIYSSEWNNYVRLSGGRSAFIVAIRPVGASWELFAVGDDGVEVASTAFDPHSINQFADQIDVNTVAHGLTFSPGSSSTLALWLFQSGEEALNQIVTLGTGVGEWKVGMPARETSNTPTTEMTTASFFEVDQLSYTVLPPFNPSNRANYLRDADVYVANNLKDFTKVVSLPRLGQSGAAFAYQTNTPFFSRNGRAASATAVSIYVYGSYLLDEAEADAGNIVSAGSDPPESFVRVTPDGAVSEHPIPSDLEIPDGEIPTQPGVESWPDPSYGVLSSAANEVTDDFLALVASYGAHKEIPAGPFVRRIYLWVVDRDGDEVFAIDVDQVLPPTEFFGDSDNRAAASAWYLDDSTLALVLGVTYRFYAPAIAKPKYVVGTVDLPTGVFSPFYYSGESVTVRETKHSSTGRYGAFVETAYVSGEETLVGVDFQAKSIMFRTPTEASTIGFVV